MVVIHPGRHHWLESGAESHFFHPMHKSGIFRHTLSNMTTMEIRSFTYRFLRRNINGAQLFKYQRYKRNVSQLLYRTLNENEIDSLITQLSLKSLRSCRPCRLRLLWWQRPWPQRWTNRFLVVVGNRDCGCSSRDTCHGNLLFVNRYSGEFLIAGLDGERLCTVPQRSCLPQPLPWLRWK